MDKDVVRDEVIKMMLPRIQSLARFYARGVIGVEFDDLVQEGCIEVWLKMGEYDEGRGASLKTMLTHVVRNRMLNLLKRWRARQVDAHDAEDMMGNMDWEEAEVVVREVRERLGEEATSFLDALLQVEGPAHYHAMRAKKGLTEIDLGKAAGLSVWGKGTAKQEIREKIGK